MNVYRGTALTACAVALVAGTLTACGSDRTGVIKEVETGRNGVKVEVYADSTGGEDYEVYLVPGMQEYCQTDERLADCADADDYLVSRAGAVPGPNRDRDR
jgi:hypothetical protein